MSDRFKAFWLGLLIIAGIAVIGWLLLFLKPSVGDGKLELRVRFSNIDRVQDGMRVTFAGRPVGEVAEIREIKDPREAPSDEFGNLYIYELTLKVDSSVSVYSYDEIVFATSGLLGEKSISINPKAPPVGAPPPQNVTHEILYARSIDKLEIVLTQLTQVAETFEDAMEGVGSFLDSNKKDFNIALKSISSAADEVRSFMTNANETEFLTRANRTFDTLNVTMNHADRLINQALDQQIVARMGESLDHIQNISTKIANGEGTLGRLINSDSLYLQLVGTMCKFETVLSDINNYGLLFQYNRTWQRARCARMNKMSQLCTPCDFYNYFNEEMSTICVSLNRVSRLIQTLDCPVENDCFADSFLELLGKVEHLEYSLKLYTEMMMGNYCQRRCN